MKKQLFKRICLWLMLALCLPLGLSLLVGCTPDGAVPETDPDTAPPSDAPTDTPADTPAETPTEEPTAEATDAPTEEPNEDPPSPSSRERPIPTRLPCGIRQSPVRTSR